MKKISTILAILALLVFAACNNANDKTAASTSTDTPKAAAPDTPKAPEFKPFDVVEISHAVKNYSKWKPLFDNDSTARKANGMEFIVIGRKNDKPNDVI